MISHMDWAYESGISLPDRMYEYVTRGEPGNTWKQAPILSSDDIDSGAGGIESFETGLIDLLDVQDRRLRERYPYSYARYFSGVSEKEIAESEGVGLRTVERRIAQEKQQLAQEYAESLER